MKKILLACDLDNTLIYSYKHRQPEDGCVEWLEGREQSFMTARCRELLPRLAGMVLLVPVTTRSVQQYRRICWPMDRPKWAVATNGGLLLAEDEPEPTWQAEAVAQTAVYSRALAELAARLDQAGYTKRRMVDDIYLYVVCPDVAAAEQCAAEFAGFSAQAGLQVMRGGRKVYFLPLEINKGAALRRLRQLWPDYRVIAAGDSELDLPMLEEADAALLPNEALAAQLHNPRRYVCPPEEHFSEFVVFKTLDLAE